MGPRRTVVVVVETVRSHSARRLRKQAGGGKTRMTASWRAATLRAWAQGINVSSGHASLLHKKARGACSMPSPLNQQHAVLVLLSHIRAQERTPLRADRGPKNDTRMMPIAWTTSPPSHRIESPREKHHARCPMSGLVGLLPLPSSAPLACLPSLASKLQTVQRTGSKQTAPTKCLTSAMKLEELGCPGPCGRRNRPRSLACFLQSTAAQVSRCQLSTLRLPVEAHTCM